MKRLGLIALAVVGLVILGTWLAVGRGPSGDAEACQRIVLQITPTVRTMNATAKTDYNYNEAVTNFRRELAKAAGGSWPNMENEDLKAVLQRLAAAPITEDITGDLSAFTTLCKVK